MNQNYVLDLDGKNKVAIEIDQASIDMCCVCNVCVTLFCEEQVFYCNPVDPYLSTELVKENLMHVLINDLYLHQSLNKDIGFLFNQYLYQRYQRCTFSGDSIIMYDLENVWIGKKYQLWGGNNVTSWLYNAADGSIVFEVTPVYPKTFSSDDFNHQDFFEWMSHYRPLCTVELSYPCAQKWLQQVTQLLKDMNAMFYKRDRTICDQSLVHEA